MTPRIVRRSILVLLALGCPQLPAIEENNRNRWTEPVGKGPDKDVPGYLINLGPTGARATLESNSFTVKYLFEESPAAGNTDEVKELVYSWNTIPKKGIWVWSAAYPCILLSEYHLATGDEGVLETIQGLAALLESGQVEDMANYQDRTHGKMGNVGHKFRTGGLGHNTNVGGYGTMNITTALVFSMDTPKLRLLGKSIPADSARKAPAAGL